jgi:hypothetical protein
MKRAKLILATTLSLSAASSCSRDAAHATSQVLGAGDGRGGISVVVLSLEGGNWSDRPETCGRAHLAEHMAARRIDARLRAAQIGFGYAIDGFTGPDESVVLVTVGGGTEGLRTALQAIGGAAAEPEARAVMDQELRLIRQEQELKANEGRSILPLAAALRDPDRQRLLGNCPASAPPAPNEPRPGRIWVVSESDPTAVQELLRRSGPAPRSAPAVPPLASAFLASQGASESLAFFTSLAGPPHTGERLVGSVAAWLLVERSLGSSAAPRFVPIGTLGYLTLLSRPVDPNARIGAVDGASDGAKSTALARARSIVCRNRATAETPAQRAAMLVSLDAWARIATFSDICSSTGAALGPDALAAVRAAAPLPAPPQSEPAEPANSPRPSGRIDLCGFSQDELVRFRGYYTALSQRLLIDELRFNSGSVLRIDAAPAAPPNCLSYTLYGSVERSQDIQRRLVALSLPARLGPRLAAAHRSQCVFLPLGQRASMRDRECRASAKPRTLEELRRVLAQGVSVREQGS